MVVWRPLANASETSRTRIAASGISALTIVDFPMPDWPTSTVWCPASHDAMGVASRTADNGTTG